jgi:hypothetical protein
LNIGVEAEQRRARRNEIERGSGMRAAIHGYQYLHVNTSLRFFVPWRDAWHSFFWVVHATLSVAPHLELKAQAPRFASTGASARS